MNRPFIKSIKRIALISVGLLLPVSAFANDGMPPSVFEMIQKDQDVKIVPQIADSGEPGLDNALKLERQRDDGDVTVITDKTVSPDDAIYVSEPGCR